MRDASAFEATTFLGLSRHSKRDPYRLGLLAEHLEADERPMVLLAVHGGTLVVTDGRILEFRAHLEAHGAWNVKEFQGYEVRRQIPRSSVREVEHHAAAAVDDARTVEDSLRLLLVQGTETILVSRGPEPTLAEEDIAALRAAILRQPK